MKLSTQQRRILTTLAATKRGRLPTDFLLSVVLKIPHRNLASGNPPATVARERNRRQAEAEV